MLQTCLDESWTHHLCLGLKNALVGLVKILPDKEFDDNQIQIFNFVIKFENVAGTSISGLHPPKENRPNSKFSILMMLGSIMYLLLKKINGTNLSKLVT